MHTSNPKHFPFSPKFTSIDRIVSVPLPNRHYATGTQWCQKCGFKERRVYGMPESYLTPGLSKRRIIPAVWAYKNGLTAT